MSIISKITVKTHCNDLGGKIWNPAIRWTSKYAVFIEITDDDGRTGLGECWCFDSKPDALVTFIRTEVAPHFLGLPLDEVNNVILQKQNFATLSARHGILASALSGIDIAVWDISSQLNAKPLWKNLNPEGSGQALCYASGGLYGEVKDAKALAAEISSFSKTGFQISKMKIGALSEADDLARIYSVLSELPEQNRLIIDCVYSYNYDAISSICDQLPMERVEAIQSPVSADDYHAMSRLVEQNIPVMANEAEYRSELHLELIERRAVRFLQTAPIACGGISRVQALSKLTRNTPINLSLEISSTAVALTTAAHLAASDASIAHVEYHSVHEVFFDALPLQALPESGGIFSLPAESGLGISLPTQGLITEFEIDKNGTTRSTLKATKNSSSGGIS